VPQTQKRRWVKPVVVTALAVGLVVGVGATTTVITSEQGAQTAAGLRPSKTFDPAEKAAELFPIIVTNIPGETIDIVQLHQGVQQDEAAFGAEFGQDLGAGSFVVPVRIEGRVSDVDDSFIYLEVEGLDGEEQAVIPIAAALNGGPVRDALGIIQFGDVPDQIAFQTLAQEIKNLMQAQVIDPLDTSSLVGKDIVVIGAWKNGLMTSQYIVQPVIIEVG